MRRPWHTWLFVGTLFVLCAVLGVLQYQWIGEVSVSLRDRLRAALQLNLARLSQDFNNEIASGYRSIAPVGAADAREAEALFLQQARRSTNTKLFRRMGLAIPRDGSATLQLFSDGELRPAEWPAEWAETRRSIEARMLTERPMGNPWREGDGLVFEAPLFAPGGPGRSRGMGRPPFGRIELGWVVFELNGDYLRDTLLPEVVQRHLDPNEYEVEV